VLPRKDALGSDRPPPSKRKARSNVEGRFASRGRGEIK